MWYISILAYCNGFVGYKHLWCLYLYRYTKIKLFLFLLTVIWFTTRYLISIIINKYIYILLNDVLSISSHFLTFFLFPEWGYHLHHLSADHCRLNYKYQTKIKQLRSLLSTFHLNSDWFYFVVLFQKIIFWTVKVL